MPKTTQMEKKIKRSVETYYSAKETDPRIFDYDQELHSLTKEYGHSGELVKEMRSPVDVTEYRYENGKLAEEMRNWMKNGIMGWHIEYDSEGYKKPYNHTQWSEGQPYELSLDVSYDEQGRRVEEYFHEYEDKRHFCLYENGKCIWECYKYSESALECQYKYDSAGRLIEESSVESSVFSDDCDSAFYKYDYDEDGNLLLKKIAKEFKLEGDDEITKTFVETEYVREGGQLTEEVEYTCDADSLEQFLDGDGYKRLVPARTTYLRNEEVVESTPYMKGEMGPFVVKVEKVLEFGYRLKSRQIDICSQDGSTLLKSILVLDLYRTEPNEEVTVCETIYEYYE